MTSELEGIVADAASLNIREGLLSTKYEVGDEIGSGSHGRALLAERHEDGEKVVIKEIRLADMDEKAQKEALSEVRVLSQFEHVNIVRYYEAVLEEGCLNIVMEYASCGDLGDVVLKRQEEKKPFQEDEIMFWFVQIVLALFHVHSKNILHRDLKSQNIFIAEGNILKLGDFGISRVLTSDTELANTYIGTPYYLSPEICEDRPYNRKSDVWALGCVLYELATLKRAFDGQSLPALIVRILKGKYPLVPTRYSPGLRSLVDSMLQQNPKDRPSVDDILRLEYVRNHVGRYAQHVMALTPIEPGALGVEVPHAGHKGAMSEGGGRAAAKPAVPARRLSLNARRGSDPLSPSSSNEGAPAARSPPVAGRRATPPPNAAAAAAAAAKPYGAGAAGGGGVAWMKQQQAALQELEGVFQQHSVSPLPKRTSISQEVPRASHPSPAPRAEGSVCSLDSTVPSGQIYKARLVDMKQARRESELEANKNLVQQERERKKIAAERKTKEVNAALRNRQEERQRMVERNLMEQRAEAEAKAAKTAEARGALKLKEVKKEEEKRKLQGELECHMAAHRDQIKAAKARTSREELYRLGAQFEKRVQHGVPQKLLSAPGPPQVLVIFPSSAQGKAVAGAPPPQTSSSARGFKGAPPLQSQRPPSRGGTPSAAAAAIAQLKSSPYSVAAVAGVGQKASPRGAAAGGGAKPWKRSTGLNPAGGFPDVEIFTPFGSELEHKVADRKSAERPKTPQLYGGGGAGGGRGSPSPRSSANGGGGGRGLPSPRVSSASGGPKFPPLSPRVSSNAISVNANNGIGPARGPDNKPAAIWAHRNGNNLLEVLSQIQDVLSEEQPSDPAAPKRRSSSGFSAPTPTPSRPTSAASRPTSASRATPAVGSGASPVGFGSKLVLPPEDDDLTVIGVEKSAVLRPASANRGGQQQQSGVSNAQKIEMMRSSLERELGSVTFTAAYNYLREVQRGEDDDDDDDDDDTNKPKLTLESILGSRINLSRQIHKLMVLEDSVFS